VQLVLGQNLHNSLSQKRRAQQAPTTNLDLPSSQVLGSFLASRRTIVFPCPPFLLSSALLFVIYLLFPLQMNGPTLGPTPRPAPSHLESFKLYHATSWKGVMPLPQTVGSLMYYTLLVWTRLMISTRNLLLHQLDASAYTFFE
jgi:hypothetical protein